MPDSPSLVLSIDFELRWGVHDSQGPDPENYRVNLEGVREVVPRLLDLFEKLEVRATWATVGAMSCEGWDDYFARRPQGPQYLEPRLRFDPRWVDRDPHGHQHFAPRLVEDVATTAGQEVGSHTFGHIYFREPGVMRRDVAADSEAAAAVLAERAGYAPRSLVFPRNQVGFVDTLQQAGIDAVRTHAPGWAWQRTESVRQSSLVRALRLWSAFRPRVGAHSNGDGVAGLPATSFVRFNLPETAFRASMRALAAKARRLKPGESLHLWFHPHNLGDAPARKVGRLRQIIESLHDAAPQARWRTFAELVDADH